MGKIIIVEQGEVECVFLTRMYEYEYGIAKYITQMLELAKPIDLNFDADIEEFQRAKGIDLHEGQITTSPLGRYVCPLRLALSCRI